MKLRDYQNEAVGAVFNYWDNGGSNPLVNMATGLGKSAAVAETARILCEEFKGLRVLMLVHVKELVAQNYATLLRIWPRAQVGIYSASLQKRQLGRQITYAGIASVYKKADALGLIDVVLVDEAHLIPHGDEGMYRTLIDALRVRSPNLVVVGFTATPFRTGSGRLDQGANRLFDEIVFNYGVGEGVRDGWLAPLAGYKGAVEFDVTGVDRRMGDFVQSQLDASFNAQDAILQKACDEIVVAGADRKSWLLFGAGVKHAYRIAECLRERGIDSVETVTGETPQDERDRIIAAFKRGEIRALTNAMVLTTGFDAPGIDLIALLRSTLSTVLYVQMMGRGTRIDGVDPEVLNSTPTAEARRELIFNSCKPNCRILDYGGNIRRHGPVDAIWIKTKEDRIADDDTAKVTVQSVKARECPSCAMLIPALAVVCPECGFEDPAMVKAKHDAEAEKDIDPMRGTEKAPPEEATVMAWSFRRHTKYGADPATAKATFRVDFMAGLSKVSEFPAFDHEGLGRTKAQKWWRTHQGAEPPPESVDEALSRTRELRKPSKITVERDGSGYLRIIDRSFILDDGGEIHGYEPPPAESFNSPRNSFADLNFDDDIPF